MIRPQFTRVIVRGAEVWRKNATLIQFKPTMMEWAK